MVRAWAVAAVVLAASASAEGLTAGPSIPMAQVTLGTKQANPVQLAPGLGVMVGGDLFPTTLLGKPVHWLSLGGDVFGNLSSGGELSLAVHATVLETLSLGFGAKLLSAGGHALMGGKPDHEALFFVIGLDPTLCYRLIYGHAPSLAGAP